MSEMDRKDDPATPSSSSTSKPKLKPRLSTSIGSIRWAEGELSSTPKRDGSFTMDVSAFEKKLDENRERKLHEESPRIDIRLKSIPTISKSAAASPSGNEIKVNICQGIESSVDEVDHATPSNQMKQTTRVVTYEKVFKQKSIREISIVKKCSPTNSSDNVQTPKVQRPVEYSIAKSSSSEQIGNADDSAYHSQRIRIASSGTPTTVSISSSNASLPSHDFTSDENICVSHRTPSRERIFSERADSEPRHFPTTTSTGETNNDSLANVSMNIVYTGDRATSAHELNLVSSVTDGNDHTIRGHSVREHLNSSSECASPDWYSEYQAQSFHTDRSFRMDFKRSNSQYDNHIRQIRGIHSRNLLFSCSFLSFFFVFFHILPF